MPIKVMYLHNFYWHHVDHKILFFWFFSMCNISLIGPTLLQNITFLHETFQFIASLWLVFFVQSFLSFLANPTMPPKTVEKSGGIFLTNCYKVMWEFHLQWDNRTCSVLYPNKNMNHYKMYSAVVVFSQLLWAIFVINAFMYDILLPIYPFPRISRLLLILWRSSTCPTNCYHHTQGAQAIKYIFFYILLYN